jgi:hypothetical protein
MIGCVFRLIAAYKPLYLDGSTHWQGAIAMPTYKPEHSFIATIKCQNAGFEGFWDRHQVEAHPAGGDLEGLRLLTSYLTLNNFYNYPDVDERDRCRFIFKCYAMEDGSPGYQIYVRDGDGLLQLDVTQEFGSLRFYPAKVSNAYWRLFFDGEWRVPVEEGIYDGFTMRPADGRIPWTYLGQRRKHGKLTPVGRKNSGKYWYGFVDADGGPADVELINDLHVLKML